MRSAIICPITASRAASVCGVMSPNPTVENTVTAKYNAEIRLRCWPNAAGADSDIVRYDHANTTRNSGTINAIATVARSIGCRLRMIARTS